MDRTALMRKSWDELVEILEKAGATVNFNRTYWSKEDLIEEIAMWDWNSQWKDLEPEDFKHKNIGCPKCTNNTDTKPLGGWEIVRPLKPGEYKFGFHMECNICDCFFDFNYNE